MDNADFGARLAAAGTDKTKLDALKRNFPQYLNELNAAVTDAAKLAILRSEHPAIPQHE